MYRVVIRDIDEKPKSRDATTLESPDATLPKSRDATAITTQRLNSPTTHPVEAREPNKTRKQSETTWPDGFYLDDHLRTWGAEKHPNEDLEVEFEKFENHHRARGNKFVDWPRAFYGWMGRAKEFKSGGRKGTVDPKSVEQGYGDNWEKHPDIVNGVYTGRAVDPRFRVEYRQDGPPS